MPPMAGKADWEVTQSLANALGCDWHYEHPAQIMQEIAQLTPTFAGVTYEKLEALGSIQWPCTDAAPEGTPIMHADEFVRGKGLFVTTEYVATDDRASRRLPLLLTTGRGLTQYNVGAQTRRTQNSVWHPEDRLEMHPSDAEERGIEDGDWVGITSRVGSTTLHVQLTPRVPPGVVYTTFHHPWSGANVLTTDNSDWATSCPEYKVPAVQVSKVSEPSAWQARQRSYDKQQQQLLNSRKPAAQ
jgi:formate dehydrogenase major subunit